MTRDLDKHGFFFKKNTRQLGDYYDIEKFQATQCHSGQAETIDKTLYFFFFC